MSVQNERQLTTAMRTININTRYIYVRLVYEYIPLHLYEYYKYCSRRDEQAARVDQMYNKLMLVVPLLLCSLLCSICGTLGM